MRAVTKKTVAWVCRARVLVPVLVAVTVTLFVLVAANIRLAGDSAVFGAVRFENESLQGYFGAFDFTVPVILGSLLLLSAGLLVFRKWYECAATLLILPATALFVWLPKELIDRPRPEGPLEGAQSSFPSGTAAVSLMILGLLIYLVGVFVGPRRLRIGLQLLLGLGIITFGMLRVMASEHYPTDLLGGYLAGALALIAIVWLHRRIGQWQRFGFRRAPSLT